jgi:hypothetical protein
MAGAATLRVIILKPSKYAADGFVERFRRGFMPNATVPYLAGLTPRRAGSALCEVHAVDEYVRTDLSYLSLLEPSPGTRVLLALVGVQSHQLHRALDLAALARERGACAVVGGPHPMTCDTSMLQERGVSFALCEAELVWTSLLADAAQGELSPVYGRERRWEERLDPPALEPPPRRDRRRYIVPLLGVYPARGCPYSCNFCSVIKIAGHRVRGQPVETTLATLAAAGRAGVRLIFFTSDNFNKYPEARLLLEAMISERIRIPFFVQCDAQVERQDDFIELLARAGCYQIFVGAESFDTATLRAAHKFHNTPEKYERIVALCRRYGITSHFSNILGFPSDTRAGILQHLRTLRALGPDVASFYILTPIPGTEQYDEFRRDSLITEMNLDRFDGSCETWRHPNLAAGELPELLFRCYREFYAAADVARRAARFASRCRDFRRGAGLFAIAGYAAHSRLAAAVRAHPMAGGAWRVRRDRVEDYAGPRRRVFGLNRAPLPGSLALSAADEEFNRRAKFVV